MRVVPLAEMPYCIVAPAAWSDRVEGLDLQGLAARWYLGTDWETSAQVLHDDFPPGETPDGAERHNTRCKGDDCPYRTQ